MYPNTYLVGIDINPFNLSSSKSKYDDVILANAISIPFRDKSFDYSTCIDVLDLPELRPYRHLVMREIERVTRKSVFYHFFNGKIGPMKELVKAYGKVKYIGGISCQIKIIDGYKRRYRYQKVRFKELTYIEDKEINRYLKILSSQEPNIEQRKFCLGSYLIEIDLKTLRKEEITHS